MLSAHLNNIVGIALLTMCAIACTEYVERTPLTYVCKDTMFYPIIIRDTFYGRIVFRAGSNGTDSLWYGAFRTDVDDVYDSSWIWSPALTAGADVLPDTIVIDGMFVGDKRTIEGRAFLNGSGKRVLVTRVMGQ